jgi:GNAT superfamily N-acetyltransferase
VRGRAALGMTATVISAIRPLGLGDTAAAVALSNEAGWNQVAADWDFMLAHGRAFGIDGPTGLGASALVLPLGPRVAWISMVLVTAGLRRLGLGTRLLEHCIGETERMGCAAGLDATEFGRPVYLPLGFRDLYALSRLKLDRRPAPLRPPAGVAIRRLDPAQDLVRVAAYDAPRSALARRPVLDHLAARRGDLAFVAERDGAVCGHLMARDGRFALQIGPLVADDEATAAALVAAVTAVAPPPYVIDVPDAQTAFQRWLAAEAATRQRGFMRMLRGEAPGLDNGHDIYAIGGPELA